MVFSKNDGRAAKADVMEGLSLLRTHHIIVDFFRDVMAKDDVCGFSTGLLTMEKRYDVTRHRTVNRRYYRKHDDTPPPPKKLPFSTQRIFPTIV